VLLFPLRLKPNPKLNLKV